MEWKAQTSDKMFKNGIAIQSPGFCNGVEILNAFGVALKMKNGFQSGLKALADGGMALKACGITSLSPTLQSSFYSCNLIE